MDEPSLLPDVHFGSVNAPQPDWRKHQNEHPDHEDDPDDEELEHTPPDVINLLGFDPKEPEVEDDNGDNASTDADK